MVKFLILFHHFHPDGFVPHELNRFEGAPQYIVSNGAFQFSRHLDVFPKTPKHSPLLFCKDQLYYLGKLNRVLYSWVIQESYDAQWSRIDDILEE